MINRKKNIEFGILLSLVLLILSYGWEVETELAAIGTLALTLLIPQIYTPFTWLWFKLGEILGKAMTFFILLIVFVGVVTPIGKIRSILKKDTLQLKEFGKNSKSAFAESHKIYSASDLEKQF